MTPTAPAATVKRPWSRPYIAISKPWPSSPTRFSAGTSTFSKKSSPVEPAQMPELVLGVARRDARPVALDDERRDALVLRGRVGLREDELVVGDRGVRDPVLLPVQDVGVALAARGRAHRGDVGAGGRLGQPEAGELLAARLRHEVALLLLLGAVAQQRRASSGRRGRRSASGTRPRRARSPRTRAPPRRSRGRRRRTPPG